MEGLSFLAPLQLGSTNGQESEMADLVRARLRQEDLGAWEVRLDRMWCAVYPPNHRMREQGWKLHVAATRFSAKQVLERSLGVLLHHHCAFKCASTLTNVSVLNSRHYSRGGAGKFITVYPDDDEQFCRLAEELDAATAGLPGPLILSDHPYRPGSLVHYRYGAFVGRQLLTNDSNYQAVLVGPDGSLVEDRRDAWFNPPAWAVSPLNGAEPAQAETVASGPVLLGDRFVVRRAIRHANKGGVYLATDTYTDAEVIIKEARPHVETCKDGSDIRDRLRHEAELLDMLEPIGVVPRKIELFEQEGHVFLAEELILGTPLSRWAAERMRERTNGQPGLPWPLAATVTRKLADLLALVHATGLVLRDLAPNNVMVDSDGGLRLIDLELAALPGTPVTAGGTEGYAAPEQLAGEPAAMEVDLFSLGAVIFTLAMGTDPVFLDDEPPVRSVQARLEYWSDITAEHNEAAKRLKPLILGLTDPTPERRWDLKRVHTFLDEQERTLLPSHADVPKPVRRLALSDLEHLIEGGIEFLLASMTPDQERLWPSTCFGSATDPCNMHHGAAGVLAVLSQAAQHYGSGRLRDTLRAACGWIEQRLPTEPLLLPGLNFGRAGTAWALYDAARALDDDAMTERALAFAKRIPIIWPNPDVTHGAAGAGLAQLYLWQATGDAEFRERVERCADGLVAAATHEATGVVWTVPPSFDSMFAGYTYYGFAHGIAGIAWFLLAAGVTTNRDDYVMLARAAGETLITAAHHDDGRATWSEGPVDDAGRYVHWCHGSSGVSTFLIRLWQVTGDERCRTLAEMATAAVLRGKWQDSPAVCHGLAGNGDFLLDMAAALGDDLYRGWAEEFAAVLFARRAYREGWPVIPDETGIGLAADYGVGLAGVVAFLLRLRHGGPRMWMAEPASLSAGADC